MEEVDDECDQKGLLLEYVRKASSSSSSSSAAPFLVKTYMLVEDPATDQVISWNEQGTGFIVWQTADFSTDLLPTLFKHSNFSSFIRQLNTYGFRKVATSRWEFSNEMFRKGEKQLLSQIRRKKACSTSSNNKHPSSSCNNNNNNAENDDDHQKETCDDEQQRYSSSATSSSSEYNCLIDENKRLKKENVVLSSELSTMKMKCKELLHLVNIHHTSNVAEKETNDEDEENEKRPKLFGVRLEVEEEIIETKRKRKRDEISKSVNVFLSQSCK